MFRLLGILTVGNLLFGGGHHRRSLRRGLLFGALLGYLANKDFDMDRVQKEARDAARRQEKQLTKRPVRSGKKSGMPGRRRTTGRLRSPQGRKGYGEGRNDESISGAAAVRHPGSPGDPGTGGRPGKERLECRGSRERPDHRFPGRG